MLVVDEAVQGSDSDSDDGSIESGSSGSDGSDGEDGEEDGEEGESEDGSGEDEGPEVRLALCTTRACTLCLHGSCMHALKRSCARPELVALACVP